MIRLRSIRSKLVCSLAFVMVMLMLQAFGGFSGLRSYRSLILDLNREFATSPRTTDVLSAISAVYEPLAWQPIDTPDGRQYWRSEIETRLERLQELIEQYHRRMLAESMPPDRRMLTETFLHRAEDQLLLMQKRDLPLLAAPETAPAAVATLQTNLAQLQLTILNTPRARQGFEGRLEAARTVYHTSFWIITVATGCALVLFGVVARLTYRWIFEPIRELHQGASRVAQGNFNYRVAIHGNDEMAELADKFNQMTSYFEQTRDDLDSQVRERTKQALRSERLAGVGFLSAGVAHEINNPLSAISMAAESLESRIHEAKSVGGLGPDDLTVLSTYLSMIQREAFRCQQITQRLLNFARGHDAPRTLHDLAAIVGEVLDMVGHMSRFRGYEIVFDRTQSVWLTVNGSEIKQVILNMVANALESMSQTGRLEISIQEQPDEVLLTFKDNGCGMTPHVLENLFEPFFTAKASGRGTGLGLSITHRIVTDHGGRIEAFSEGAGKGSTFQVHLPRRAVQAVAA